MCAFWLFSSSLCLGMVHLRACKCLPPATLPPSHPALHHPTAQLIWESTNCRPQTIAFRSPSPQGLFWSVAKGSILSATQTLADVINNWIINEVPWTSVLSINRPSFPNLHRKYHIALFRCYCLLKNVFGSLWWEERPPKEVCILIPGTCEYVFLHGKRDFANVIRVKDLKLGELF